MTKNGQSQGKLEAPVTPAFDPADWTITIAPLEEHKLTVVFLHGLGDTGRGWAGRIRELPQLPNVKWVFPSASRQPVSTNGGLRMPSWFDILAFSERVEDVSVDVDRAAQHIAGILREEQAAAPPGTKIVLGGISQGGATSLHMAVRKHVGTFLDGSDASSVPLDATVSVCAWLPAAKSLPGVSLKSPEAAAQFPLLMCHGEEDTLVRFSFGKESAELLRTLGFSSLDFKAYPCVGHTASHEELDDVRDFVKSLVPQ